MKIEVRQTGGEWVLPRLSKSFAEYMPKGDGQGKEVIFYSLYNMVPKEKYRNEISIAFFTHDSGDGNFELFAERCDYIICMAPQYERQLRKKGFKNIRTITIPPEPQFECKLVIAWLGHFYNKYRKGFELYDKVKQLEWVKLLHPDHIPFEEIPSVIERCDYTLCTSRMEGGPLPLVESLACGKKMIIPVDVGNADCFLGGIIPYHNSNWDSLLKKLELCYHAKLKIANLVKDITWNKFTQDMEEVLHEIDNW